MAQNTSGEQREQALSSCSPLSFVRLDEGLSGAQGARLSLTKEDCWAFWTELSGGVIEFEEQAGERYRSAIAWRVRREQIESALGQDIRRGDAGLNVGP